MTRKTTPFGRGSARLPGFGGLNDKRSHRGEAPGLAVRLPIPTRDCEGVVLHSTGRRYRSLLSHDSVAAQRSFRNRRLPVSEWKRWLSRCGKNS
jgi:hypothetical protein